MITWENYEEYMVMHADGELSAAQEQELMSFLYEHPDLQSELTAFSMTRMTPDEAETYTYKESLLKPVVAEQPKLIAFPHWQRYAVAAGVAALLFVSGYRFLMPANDSMDAFARIENSQKAVIPEVREATATPALAEMKGGDATTEKLVAQASPATRPEMINSSSKHRAMAKIVGSSDHVALAALTEIEKIETAGVRELPEEKKIIAAAVTNVPPLAIQYREDETEDAVSFIDKLPIAETKKNGMKNLASEVASGYSKVNSIRQEIAQSTVSFKLRNKKLILSF